ncbi:unnamed protein product [Phytophthora lilii]|uniref:Unnamed protein product n=1 Tax=Phytophthora lilii TaxID=2077276 RepID=A0A9W6WU86_9STRA|nr:unnamed protein product [Phytophthora lilii]
MVRPTSTAAASMTTANTADEIRGVMDALKLDVVASYFDQDDDEIDPYVVCEGVSVDAFNDTADVFKYEFMAATGNRREVASGGSMTANRDGNPNKEADATFGPKRTTLNRTPAPAPRTVTNWVTLAVEVGRSQTWASLVEAAEWWCNYSGIQYILLLKISPQGVQMRYALYDIAVHGILPASGTFRRRTRDQPAVDVSFDMRRILSIPPNAALPPGVSPTARVDLRIVMNLVIDSLE